MSIKRIVAWLLILMMLGSAATNCLCPFAIQIWAEELSASANESEDQVSETNTTTEDIAESVSENTSEVTETEEEPITVDLGLSAPSYILMEPSTQTVILEQNADEVLRPASITKIMTLILIFDALTEGRIELDDEVTVSEYAASMGGSQVFLEAGEKQTVDTMIKCIAVASANDACVAMAEFISASETEFVNRMNERAKGLGMDKTFFMNCNGLDVDGHVTSARDVAKMSRELIIKYPQIHEYSKIWMENITHTTAKGSEEFGLSNTNKLMKQYEYATGLKTGSTDKAKYCVSATANKEGVELIAVVMAAPDHKVRFHDAVTLLNYGYSVSAVYKDENKDTLSAQKVVSGVEDEVDVSYASPFSYLSITNEDFKGIVKEIRMEEVAQAPIVKGNKAGEAVYMLNGKRLGSVDIVYDMDVKKARMSDYIKKVYFKMLL
ncbi:MAG: D-alanyl-D-alanine carboxypeptidase [Lachnospiraceae bacterium]|nr:D-alanyl-D-alanine carboxypeptidase [Lachnospiraceae bacterium]